MLKLCALAVSTVLAPPADAQSPSSQPASFDWVATGWDCSVFAAADLDRDGFGDVLTINGAGQLCAALSVSGWKASPWRVLRDGVAAGAVGIGELQSDDAADVQIAVVWPDHVEVFSGLAEWKLQIAARFDAPAGIKLADTLSTNRRFHIRNIDERGELDQYWTVEHDSIKLAKPPTPLPDLDVAPPPFEPGAEKLLTFRGDMNNDGFDDTLATFSATKPHQHRVVRVTLSPNPQSTDQDSDGLSDDEEVALHTDPFNRDCDSDGLLDGWEIRGLPRGVPGPNDGSSLDPLHQDVIVVVAPYEGTPLDAVKPSLEKSKRIYAQLNTANPDAAPGINIHYRFDPAVPPANQGHWHDVAMKHFPSAQRGLMHFMQVAGLGGGGQAQQLGDEGGSGAHFAAFAHELGHQLGLSHTGDCEPAWCPLYPSIMNYAFNYSLGGDGEAIKFSDGRFAALELNESALSEHLPFAIADLAYLRAGPFTFTIEEDAAGGCKIDWNHNGVFDETPVQADINYGSSTSCGVRREMGKVGAGPAMARVGQSVFLATLDPTQGQITLRHYLGDEKWSDPVAAPSSATEHEPVLIGDDQFGYLLFRRVDGWRLSRFDANSISNPMLVKDLPQIELAGGIVAGRLLLVGRRDDNSLPAWWLSVTNNDDGSPKVDLAAGPAIDFPSQVPVDFTIDPGSGRLVMVGSSKNPDNREMCLQIAWFDVSDDGTLHKAEQRFVGGEHARWNCTTRPIVRFTSGSAPGTGELYIFHTGWPDESGQMTMWRSKQVGNRALNDGWLLSMLYDIWTRTRRPIAFEMIPQAPADGTQDAPTSAAQGALYAFRWDAGAFPDGDNRLLVAHNGLGIDPQPMRDHDDGARIAQFGIRHSILFMRRAD